MRTSRRGQAAYEFAIAAFIFAMLVALFVQFAPLLTRNLEMLDSARCDAGVAALDSASGSRTAAMTAASRIAARANWQARPPAVPGAPEMPGSDAAWGDAIRTLPSEPRFRDWRDGRPRATSLAYGTAKETFTVPVWFDGSGARTETDVHVSEEVFFPAMGQGGALQ